MANDLCNSAQLRDCQPALKQHSNARTTRARDATTATTRTCAYITALRVVQVHKNDAFVGHAFDHGRSAVALQIRNLQTHAQEASATHRNAKHTRTQYTCDATSSAATPVTNPKRKQNTRSFDRRVEFLHNKNSQISIQRRVPGCRPQASR